MPAAVLNAGQDQDAAEQSDGQLAARLAAAVVSKASEQWELPASESAWERSAAKESGNLERNQLVDRHPAQRYGSAAVEAVAAVLELGACRAMPR